MQKPETNCKQIACLWENYISLFLFLFVSISKHILLHFFRGVVGCSWNIQRVFESYVVCWEVTEASFECGDELFEKFVKLSNTGCIELCALLLKKRIIQTGIVIIVNSISQILFWNCVLFANEWMMGKISRDIRKTYSLKQHLFRRLRMVVPFPLLFRDLMVSFRSHRIPINYLELQTSVHIRINVVC